PGGSDHGKDATIPVRNRNAGASGVRLDPDASGRSATDQGATGFQPAGGEGRGIEIANRYRDEASRRRSRLLWHATSSASAAAERSTQGPGSPACAVPSKEGAKEQEPQKGFAYHRRGSASRNRLLRRITCG